MTTKTCGKYDRHLLDIYDKRHATLQRKDRLSARQCNPLTINMKSEILNPNPNLEIQKSKTKNHPDPPRQQ